MNAYELDKYVTAKALELLKGCGPEHNMIPTMDVVRAAYFLGYDVVKRSPNTGDQHGT